MNKLTHFVPSSLEKQFDAWLNPLKFGEISLVVGYPWNDHERRFSQLLTDEKQIWQSMFGKNAKWQLVDFREPEITLTNFDESAQPKNENQLLAIFGFERLLASKNEAEINQIIKLYRSPFVKILLFSDQNLYDPDFEEFLSNLKSFQPRVFVGQFYDPNDAEKFIDYLENKWQFKVDPILRQKIIANSGGALGLIKEMVWFARDNSQASFEENANHAQLQSILKSFWNQFSKSSQLVLADVVHNQKAGGLSTVIAYLKQIKIINNEGTKLLLPLLEKYIKEYVSNPLSPMFDGQQIFIDQQNVTNFFTKKQRRILKKLIANPEKIISREDLMNEIWQQNDLEASDWALDCHINRLRHRLEEIGLGEKHLITKRGKGFLWKP